jgi:hypothetical protein
LATGLAARGYDVTILHSGAHEVHEVAGFPHPQGDVFSEEGLRTALGDRSFSSLLR